MATNAEMAEAFARFAFERREQARRAYTRAEQLTAQAEEVKQQAKAQTKEAEGYEKTAAELRK